MYIYMCVCVCVCARARVRVCVYKGLLAVDALFWMVSMLEVWSFCSVGPFLKEGGVFILGGLPCIYIHTHTHIYIYIHTIYIYEFDLLAGDALLRVDGEHSGDEVLGSVRDRIPVGAQELVLATLDLEEHTEGSVYRLA